MMRVLARSIDYGSCPADVGPFVNREQARVTAVGEYVAHALVVFGGITHVQVVDDLGFPSWKPAWLFSFSESSLEEDWICSVFPEDDPQLILGPRFLVKDQAAYAKMVELEAEQANRFWKRLDAQKEKAG